MPRRQIRAGECGDAVCAHAAEARETFAIVVTRVLPPLAVDGQRVGVPLFSLFGGLLSLIVMGILLKAEGRFCSLFGVSVGAACGL